MKKNYWACMYWISESMHYWIYISITGLHEKKIIDKKDVYMACYWIQACTWHVTGKKQIYQTASKTQKVTKHSWTSFIFLGTLSFMKFSTITVMCMRWQSWKVMPCPHKPATRNSEKIIDKNRACPHKPATRNSEKIIDKNRARTAGYWITGLLLY